MKQAIVFPLKKILKKFTTWEINRDKDILKEDSQASSRVLIINKDNGDHTLAIQFSWASQRTFTLSLFLTKSSGNFSLGNDPCSL